MKIIGYGKLHKVFDTLNLQNQSDRCVNFLM